MGSEASGHLMPLPTERDKGAHLLRRFGLGASEAELDYYLAKGLTDAVDKLLNYDAVDEGFGLDIVSLKNPKNDRIPMPAVTTWWATRMIVTRRPLQEKMTLFWHNHFATSASKVPQGLLMYQQNDTLRKNATGNFRTLLKAVSKDPAMLFWLDNQQNVKGHANENFGREVMELFTLGIGNYSEKDVQEAARAFTGWAFRRVPKEQALEQHEQAEFFERVRLHDAGEKTVLGHTGNLDGDDVLDMLCDDRHTALRLTHKLWEWFVYPDPPTAVVGHYADVLVKGNLEIKPWLRAVMTSPEFYSDKARRSVIKCPVDFCITTLRQLGVGSYLAQAVTDAKGVAPRGALAPAFAANQAMKNMGMALLYPPDVAGWNIGGSWISSATMVERMQWARKLFAPARYEAMGLFRQEPSPEGVVAKLESLFDVRIGAEKRPVLVSAARKAAGEIVNDGNANAAATAVSELIFVTPEFQVC